MKRKGKLRQVMVTLSREENKRIRLLSLRTGVSPGKIMSLIVTMELDRFNAEDA